MQPLANPPALDALEPRLLFSQLVAPLPISVRTEGGIVALKKSGKGGGDDDKSDKKPKDNGKSKHAAELTILLNGSSLSNHQATINFGSATVGETAPLRTFVIRNDGKGSLTIGTISLPAGFSLIDAPAGHIGHGDSTTFTVRLDTDRVATRSGQLAFSNNDPDEGSFAIALTGRVVAKAPPPPVTPPVKPPVTPPVTPPVQPPVATSPLVSVWRVRGSRSALGITDGLQTPVDFGTVTVGARAPVHVFRVANEGTATLRLGAIQLPTGFRLAEALTTSLAPGQVDEFTVAMDTSTLGVHRGQITFSTSDAHASVFNYSIQGNVIAPPPTTPTSTGLQGTTLVVNGTAGDDTIIVSGKSSAIYVTINGKPMTGSPFAGVTKIVVNAGSGNDSVNLSRLYLNATANGGYGNDTLIGTAGDDVLNGEAGNDNLDGGPGNDNLLGGEGDDILTGGPGMDVFHGEAGIDTINAIDGIGDSVLDSGDGADVFHRDRVDPAAA